MATKPDRTGAIVARNLEAVMKDKVLKDVQKIFIQAGKDMVNDFREAQNASPDIDPGLNKDGTARRKKPTKSDMTVALAYVASKGGNMTTVRGVPWINRTRWAQLGVHPVIEQTPSHLSVGLKHTMPYGAYLELGFNGKYAVINPIVRAHSKAVLAKVKFILGGK